MSEIERKPLTGSEIMEMAVDNLEQTVRAAKEGHTSTEDVDYVYDQTMRTISEVAFGGCDYPNYCKFYGERPGFCDRICGESVWDQI